MSRRVLLVDDEPGIVDFVRYGLQREGFEAVAVSDGEAALARARSELHPYPEVERFLAATKDAVRDSATA